MENKETTCTPCEQNFERKVNELVKEGEAPDTQPVSYTHLTLPTT